MSVQAQQAAHWGHACRTNLAESMTAASAPPSYLDLEPPPGRVHFAEVLLNECQRRKAAGADAAHADALGVYPEVV
jgi:hypothetical protein